MQGIQELLDRSIGAEPFKIKDKAGGYQGIDLSKIDFETLAKRFEKKKPTSSDLERLKAAVKAQLERMVRLNRTRADYLDEVRGTDRGLQQRQPQHRGSLPRSAGAYRAC